MADAAPAPSPAAPKPTATAATAAGTTGAAALYPIITWVIAGCPQPVPEMTAVAIAAYVAIAIHLIGVSVSRLMTRFFPGIAAGEKGASATIAAPSPNPQP